jgi:hypothetical protein
MLPGNIVEVTVRRSLEQRSRAPDRSGRRRRAVALLKRHVAKTLDDYENTLGCGIPAELG